MIYRPRTKAKIAQRLKRCPKCNKMVGTRKRCKRCARVLV